MPEDNLWSSRMANLTHRVLALLTPAVILSSIYLDKTYLEQGGCGAFQAQGGLRERQVFQYDIFKLHRWVTVPLQFQRLSVVLVLARVRGKVCPSQHWWAATPAAGGQRWGSPGSPAQNSSVPVTLCAGLPALGKGPCSRKGLIRSLIRQ